MKVVFEDGGPCRKIMRVSASAEEVAPDYGEVLETYVKAGRVPGFRQGRAPAPVVERHYARAIVDSAKDRLVPRLYRAALREHNIAPVAIVDVSHVELERSTGIQFKVTVDVAPEFTLPRYKKIAVKSNAVEVTDAQVDGAMDRLRKACARFEDVTGRPVREGDLVCIDYEGLCEGKNLAEVAADGAGLGSGTDFWMLVDQPEYIPGLASGLVGAAVDERRTVNVHFPDKHAVAGVAGKDAVYTVHVKGIRERIMPEFNAEFLKRFEVDSEAALRDKVRADLLSTAQRDDRERMKEEIVKYLIERSEFDLPQTIVDQEMNLMVRNIVQRIVRQGATRRQIEERQEDIVRTAQHSSKDRVKISYILARIAEEEKIQVEDGEVDKRMTLLAEHHRVAPERLRAEMEKKNGLEGLRSDIRAEKTLDFLLENAKIK